MEWYWELTIAITIKQSSQPKARTTRKRTKHRSNTVTSEMPKKTAVTMVITSLRPVTMMHTESVKSQHPRIEKDRRREN